MPSYLISKDVLRLHFDYTAWATKLLLEASSQLNDEAIARDLQVSHCSVLETLRHIFYADRVWLSRLKGAPQSFKSPGEAPSLAELKEQWPGIWAGFQDVISGLADTELIEILHYVNLKGEAVEAPRWQVLLHVVNHATLHRGQVMAMLRQLGQQPPLTDLIYFYLSMK
jgi:uncharacterized damage-inducible protein DinB